MHTKPYSPANLPEALVTIVAEAAAHLPPLTRKQDEEFLREIMSVTSEAFWTEFLAMLQQEERDRFGLAVEKADDAAFIKWLEDNVDFTHDPVAYARAEEVLEKLAERLPSVMRHEYPLFTEDDLPIT